MNCNLISHDYRCIFIHIPKCAGTSIESLVWPGPRSESDLWMGFVDEFHNRYQSGGLQHLKAEQVQAHVGMEVFDAYFKFSFVRHPLRRAISQYRYMAKRDDLRRFLGMSADASFSEYLELIQQFRHVQWEPQSDFLIDTSSRELLVDFVGRVETMASDTRCVFDLLKVPFEWLPHLNAAPSEAPEVRPSRSDRDLVERIYSEDFERFSY